ncbi:WSC domain-containing protein [Lachnellula occidentalis]|uniref:Peroxidase n=1 Tax=Lachnellula occidentalis TaxID=215460 RepID=A0A8H8UH56_9HELO|nr:WSC domain-containing protein [Lachnellula occidentalis]
MKMIFSKPPILNLLHFLTPASSTYFYPTVQASLLEHILVDTHGAHASDFIDAITPCTNYVNGAQTLGRTTAAQWIRVAFHDFVTADVAAGTGGVDASIGFETLREENAGSAMNDTLSFFRPRVSSKIVMADFIALAVVMSVGNCGGPRIPLRGGRVDATGGGETGVPAPDSSLAETLGFFGGAGFGQVDSIGLTACGHTMGNLHHEVFPTVVGAETVSANNTNGGVHFDSTVATFDTAVVHEYLNGTGNAGGPLVTSFNISSRSDLRLYESDDNVTMISLAKSGNVFFDTCVDLFQRMLDTVPAGVVLSDIVAPMAVKPINATLDFDNDGNLIFTGYIRILTAAAAPPHSLTLTTSLNAQALLLIPDTPISDPEAFTSFTVSSPGIPSQAFPVQAAAFIVPSLTSVTALNNSNAVVTIRFSVAVATGQGSSRVMKRDSMKRDSVAPSISIQAPVAQQGTLGPRIETWDHVPVASVGWKAGYEIWEGGVSVHDWTEGPISVSVRDGEGGEVDVVMVD